MAIPTLLELVVQGGSVALRYSEALSAILPSFNRFVVMVGGRRVYATGPAGLSADGTTILLNLATPVAVGAKVTVTYVKVNGVDKPGFGDVKSRSTAQSAGFFLNSVALNRTEPPTLLIRSSAGTLTAGETATITFGFSTVPRGFDATDIATTGGTLSALVATADPKVYTATFTASRAGTASIAVAAGTFQDAFGTSSSAAAETLISVTAPLATLTAGLSTSSDTGTIGDGITSLGQVILTGRGQGGSTVVVRGTTAQATVGADGRFFLPQVSLKAGDNLLVLDLLTASGSVVATRELRLTRETPAGPSPADDPVLAWNRLTLEAIRRDATVPTVATRAMAMQSIAVLDTLAAIDGTPAFLVGLQAPVGLPAGAAVAAAAARVLSSLYPSQSTRFRDALNADLQRFTDDAARQAAVDFGQAVADGVIGLRVRDGWNAALVVDGGTAPGQWRPTPPAFAQAQTPQWSLLQPFSLRSGSQFRPGPPPALTSTAYADALAEVQQLGSATSTARTAEQTLIARFWADGPGTYTPPGHWNQIAEELARAEGYGGGAAARLLASLNVALADSGIAAWDTKFAYTLWRPITAIRGADGDGNPATTADPTWQPLLNTPNHPEYVSGHSTFSGAAATLLDRLMGNRAFSTTSLAVPNVTRSYGTFQEAAAEAGRSRIYGGIHYDFSNQTGQALGADVASWVLEAFRTDLDLRGPQLALEQEAGGVLQEAPRLSGFAVDNLSGVASLSVTLAGRDPQLLSVDGRGRFGLDVGALFGPLADGAYSLTFLAVDGAGNRSQPLTHGFRLESAAPALSLGGLADGGQRTAIINGTPGDDAISPGMGRTMVYGGAGHDLLSIDYSANTSRLITNNFAAAATGGFHGYFSTTNAIDGVEFYDVESFKITGTGLADAIVTGSGSDTIQGGAGDDVIQSGPADDRLVGGLGADRLSGGTGADRFLYTAATEGGDLITDFDGAVDSILVSAAGFGGQLVAGMNLLASGRYVANTTGLASSAAGVGQFIGQMGTNQLLWDGDGAGGSLPVCLATFQSPQAWSWLPIQVVA